jgi:hypothetical protein
MTLASSERVMLHAPAAFAPVPAQKDARMLALSGPAEQPCRVQIAVHPEQPVVVLAPAAAL